MRDVNSGWFLRYTHANVASFFFLFLYFHTARGLYYSSYKTPRVLLWSIGVIILILTMAIAFLGYVLPYGQMSLWGATVITNLLSAIPVFGQDLVESKLNFYYNNNIETILNYKSALPSLYKGELPAPFLFPFIPKGVGDATPAPLTWANLFPMVQEGEGVVSVVALTPNGTNAPGGEANPASMFRPELRSLTFPFAVLPNPLPLENSTLCLSEVLGYGQDRYSASASAWWSGIGAAASSLSHAPLPPLADATPPSAWPLGDKEARERIEEYWGQAKPGLMNILATIGTVNKNALKKVNKLRTEKAEYLTIPYQFIAFFVGLVDGDGYIRINKTTRGYISLSLVLCLSIKDISTLEYIYSVFKFGKITIYKDSKYPICKLVINRTDLQEVVFPLLKHHKIFFLTTSRREQYDLAMQILTCDIKMFKELVSPTPRLNYALNYDSLDYQDYLNLSTLPAEAKEYLNLSFFKNWLVGFTNAEGSFCMKVNNDGCFQLKQKIHSELFEAIKLLFDTERKIDIEKNKYAQFTVSSKKDIQKVINFFSFTGLHPLIGLKSIQYFIWINNLKNSKRYENLNFPG